ncbi:hypothetical protein GCK72_009209 [Caenorhabditis remanei]|uniref:Coiled-coil domain-containing protein 25 n=1 Tax=Caenorhabditis remanei TaxID=31234 RepID=A0A6A5H2A9_CAERE|nr:hypothetical protein GCK72_009209 [Caenorhabditis remanei]KAF1760956.1 hypothetical protein GCK72_009209 [Caenorhabditis remanei]
MVFCFISTTVSPPALIYMGQHQEENEKLLKEEGKENSDDLWFHVDGMSSAHVYLQMPRGMTMETIPEELLEDCCQLVKKHSIQGCKLDEVQVVYTMKSNLKKTKGMASGQVGFHNPNLTKLYITTKKNSVKILKRLMETRWKT